MSKTKEKTNVSREAGIDKIEAKLDAKIKTAVESGDIDLAEGLRSIAFDVANIHGVRMIKNQDGEWE